MPISPLNSQTARAMQKQIELLSRDWSKSVPKSAARKIRAARQLIFLGTGSSFHAAQWGVWLFSPEKRALALTSWDFSHRARKREWRADSGDFFAVCSHRGYQELTKEAMDRIQEIAPGRLLLICAENSPTGPGKTPFIFTSPAESSQAHTMSVCGAMLAIAALAGKKPGAGLPALARRALASPLPRSFHSKPAKPGRRPITLLGAAEDFALAQELALKLREMCYLPAFAHALEEFLHGPFIALEKDDLVIHLSPNAGQRARQSLRLLTALGAKTTVPPRFVAELPEPDRSFGVLLWGQTLCLKLAALLGANPDDNRQHQARYLLAKKHARFRKGLSAVND